MSKPTPVKRTIKRSEALAIYRALTNLRGFQKTVGETVALVPFSLTDETRRLIKWNLQELKPIAEEHDDKTQELITTITGTTGEDGQFIPGPAFIDNKDEVKNANYNVRYRAYLKEPVDVDLYRIEESALLRENKNPISNLEDIAPVTDPVPAQPKEPEGGEKA